MAYELHIEREDGFTLDEWKDAVASIPEIHLDASPMTLMNPKTGEVVSISGRDGDVAVMVDGIWRKVFHFFEGAATFKSGPVAIDDPNDPVARAAFSLAQFLSAKVRETMARSMPLRGGRDIVLTARNHPNADRKTY